MDFTPRQLAAAMRVRKRLDADEFARAALAAQGTRKGIMNTIEDMTE
jgi:hypothetical protein